MAIALSLVVYLWCKTTTTVAPVGRAGIFNMSPAGRDATPRKAEAGMDMFGPKGARFATYFCHRNAAAGESRTVSRASFILMERSFGPPMLA